MLNCSLVSCEGETMPRLTMFNTIKKNQEVPWGICLYLMDGPLTMDQIKISYQNNPFPPSKQTSLYTKGTRHARRLEKLPEDLAKLVQAGWVIEHEGLYSMTELGLEGTKQERDKALSYLQLIGQKLRSFVLPETASKVTLIVQVILALIKLPAGLLSGSVGLLNDSFDTILDLFSSLLVYLGVRFNKERLISILLVVSMLITGSFTLYEAIHRFLDPFVPKVDWFPLAAALLSAVAGFGLWIYQRYVGIQSGLMTFITESVDSRNHIVVALGVTAGLIASQLQFGLLDMLVGLAVALLIVWSGIELVIELVRSTKGGQIDLSHYGFWLQGVYQYGRERYLQSWMLSLIEQQIVRTKTDLVEHIRQGVDFRENPWFQAVGLNQPLATEALLEQTLEEIIQRGWVIDQEPLLITEKGKKYLDKPKKIHKSIHL
jgi:hypothetical protein